MKAIYFFLLAFWSYSANSQTIKFDAYVEQKYVVSQQQVQEENYKGSQSFARSAVPRYHVCIDVKGKKSYSGETDDSGHYIVDIEALKGDILIVKYDCDLSEKMRKQYTIGAKKVKKVKFLIPTD